jgi:hypothetical protein
MLHCPVLVVVLSTKVGALGKMGRPDLARRAFDTGHCRGLRQHSVFPFGAHISSREEWPCHRAHGGARVDEGCSTAAYHSVI